jgi:GAF domain-containing protein
MEREDIRLDNSLLREIVTIAVKITRSERACVLLYDQTLDRLQCCYGQNCALLAEANKSGCVITLQEAPLNLRELFNGHISSGYITQNGEFLFNTANPRSQMMIPLKRQQSKPLGLLIFESSQRVHFHEEDIDIAQSVVELCALVLQESQQLANSDRMINKLGLLSAANNVLLAEFENKSLTDKFDFIVAKATEILDAELCSFWLVKEGNVVLETSYSEAGKVVHFLEKSSPITNDPRNGLTGYMAYQKEAFNLYGDELQRLRALAEPPHDADFVKPKATYSELAYPMLDEEGNLIGLFFAYNKKGEDGTPLQNSGFSKELDEPLMKVLTTKLLISIKNARILKKLRDYELIVESTPDPVVICSEIGVMTYMNPGAINLFGDLQGCQVADYFPSDENSTGLEKQERLASFI